MTDRRAGRQAATTLGGADWTEIGAALGITRQGAEQLGHRALLKARRIAEQQGLCFADLCPEHPLGFETQHEDYSDLAARGE